MTDALSPTPSAANTSDAPAVSPASPAAQPRNPLHGVTLQAMVTALADFYGWPGLAQRIPVRCFALDPSVSSSLKFLRKTPWAREKVEGLYPVIVRTALRPTPWAREKVEGLYLFMLRAQRRGRS